MRKVFFAALCLFAGGAWAQPCTPLQVRPAPRPDALPRQQDPGLEQLFGLYYAGGRYFYSYKFWPAPGASDTRERYYFAEGARFLEPQFVGQVDEPYTVGYGIPFNWVRCLRGLCFTAFGYLFVSTDGRQWQMLWPRSPHIGFPVQWTGDQFVWVGGFGEVLTSYDGLDWQYRTTVPLGTRPMGMAIADRYRLVVAGTHPYGDYRESYRGYTEDYQTWNLEVYEDEKNDLLFNGGLGNGWFYSLGLRTREGKVWERTAVAKSPEAWQLSAVEENFAAWHTFFAGRHFWAPLAFGTFHTSVERGMEIYLSKTQDLMSWQASLVGRIPPEVILRSTGFDAFDFTMAGWDGKRVWWLLMDSNVRDADVTQTGLVAFTSCADLGDPVVLPGVGHGAGAGGSFWRTRLWLHYPGPGEGEVLLQWLPHGRENAEPKERRLWLNTGESLEFDDVVWQLFGEEGFGSLRAVSVANEVVVQARTYNASGEGSYGQEIAPGRGDWRGGEGWLVGLADSGNLSEGFRTNVGIQNLWVEPVVVEVVFRDAQGQELGRRQGRLRAFEGVQWFRPLLAFRPQGVELASAVVRLVEGQGRVSAYASRVDNRTGDGSTIRAFKLPWQGTVR